MGQVVSPVVTHRDAGGLAQDYRSLRAGSRVMLSGTAASTLPLLVRPLLCSPFGSGRAAFALASELIVRATEAGAGASARWDAVFVTRLRRSIAPHNSISVFSSLFAQYSYEYVLYQMLSSFECTHLHVSLQVLVFNAVCESRIVLREQCRNPQMLSGRSLRGCEGWAPEGMRRLQRLAHSREQIGLAPPPSAIRSRSVLSASGTREERRDRERDPHCALLCSQLRR